MMVKQCRFAKMLLSDINKKCLRLFMTTTSEKKKMHSYKHVIMKEY